MSTKLLITVINMTTVTARPPSNPNAPPFINSFPSIKMGLNTEVELSIQIAQE